MHYQNKIPKGGKPKLGGGANAPPVPPERNPAFAHFECISDKRTNPFGHLK